MPTYGIPRGFSATAVPVEDGHQVEMRVSPQYNPDNLTSRPDRFVAQYRVDGGNWVKFNFVNK